MPNKSVFRKASIILILTLLSLFSWPVYSQFTADPNDRLYTLISLWEEKGYLSKLPLIRPYPLQVIKGLLKEVEGKAGDHDRQIARTYLRSLFPEEGGVSGTLLRGAVRPGLGSEWLTDTEDSYWKVSAFIMAYGTFGEYFSFSGKFAYSLSDEINEDFFPKWTSIPDESKTGGGVIELGSVTIGMAQLGLGEICFGTDWLYLQAGIERTSVGPFFENGAVIGPHAPAAGRFSLTFQPADWLSFSSIFLDLSASYVEDPDTGTKRRLNEAVKKYLILHSVSFYPFQWMSFGFLQTIVGGAVFHPAYLIPFQHTFFTQQLYGDYDSSFLGLYTQLSLPQSFRIKLVFYVDDWDAFSSASKQEGTGFNLNSAQNKFALQVGLSWSPSFQVFKRVSLDYLMVTPYTYTHYAHGGIPYLSYTHEGQGLGSVLEPNSDQLTLTAWLMPLTWLDLDLWGRLIRHGNASENYDRGDGSYYDDGFYDADTITFYGPSRFLTQKTLEIVFQTGINAYFNFPLSWGELTFGLGYTLQYVWNRDLNAGSNELNNFLHLSFGVKF